MRYFAKVACAALLAGVTAPLAQTPAVPGSAPGEAAPAPPCELVCLPPEKCICENPAPSQPCSLVCVNPGERLESVECKCISDEQ
jgi:hypothetical protein